MGKLALSVVLAVTLAACGPSPAEEVAAERKAHADSAAETVNDHEAVEAAAEEASGEEEEAATVAVPDVIGMDFEEAIAALEEVGLEVRQSSRTTDEFDPGAVASMSVIPGAQVEQGRSIRVFVAVQPEPERLELEVVETGGSTFTPRYGDGLEGSYAVVIANPNDQTHVATHVDVNITWRDDAGVIKVESDTLTALLPGETVAVGDNIYDLSAELPDPEVQVRVGEWAEIDDEPGGFAVEDATLNIREFGGLVTTATVTSSFEQDMESFYVVAVYRDNDGDIIGGDWTFADFVPGGGSVGVEITGMHEVPGAVGVDVYPRLSNLSLR